MDAGYRIISRRSTTDGQGDTRGTAWLLWPGLVVTAFHVVGSRSAGAWHHEQVARHGGYLLDLSAGQQALSPWLYDATADVAVLRPHDPAALPEDSFLLLSERPAQPGDLWRSLGYPVFEGAHRAAVAFGGTVQHVWPEQDATAIQLFVQQGTAASWGGVSGAAIRNVHDEVVGVITETMSHVSTGSAAPASALHALIAFGKQESSVGRWAEKIHGVLPPDCSEGLLAALGWLARYPETRPLPEVRDVLLRAGQEGFRGLCRCVDAAGKLAPATCAEEINALRAEIQAACSPGPDARVLAQVLAAVLGPRDSESDDLAELRGLSRADIRSAVTELERQGLIERSVACAAAGGAELSRERLRLTDVGVRTALRRDHAALLLRELGRRPATLADLRLPVPERALRRLERAAMLLGWLTGDQKLRLTDKGQEALARVERGEDPAAKDLPARP